MLNVPGRPTTGTSIGHVDQSLAQQIYLLLRDQIIDGTIPGGTWLRERELAERFGVSRIPLREALPQLEADGFIKSHPRRGTVVRTLTLKDAEEMFEVRLSVEVLVARLAALRVARGSDPAPLLEKVRLADEALAAEDDHKLAHANNEIHEAILDLTDNALLGKMMNPLLMLQLWGFGVTTERDQRAIAEEHRALSAAIAEGNAELAASLSYAHVEHSRRDTMPIIARLHGASASSD